LKTFLKNNAFIFSIYFAVIFVATYFLLSYDKVTIHTYLNQFVGIKLVDTFFFYITYFGDGRLVPFIILLVMLYNIRLGICVTISVIVATSFSSILKHYFYEEVFRPAFVFEWYIHKPLKYVDNEFMNYSNSFPSGHSTQVFSMFMCLVYVAKNNSLKLLFLSISLLTAFSRTYLSQHWLVDITFGSLIGTAFSFFFYYIFVLKNNLSKQNKSLI
jgi:membrane-associated phospholipid phosphatase